VAAESIYRQPLTSTILLASQMAAMRAPYRTGAFAAAAVARRKMLDGDQRRRRPVEYLPGKKVLVLVRDCNQWQAAGGAARKHMIDGQPGCRHVVRGLPRMARTGRGSADPCDNVG